MPENEKLPAKALLKPHLKTIGMIARWQPVHTGHLAVLEAICDQTQTALIGIGSSNAYNYRSPFTLEETTEMLHLALKGRENYTLIPVPDLNDGPRWREMVRDLFGELDLFLTANPYVASLLKDIYTLDKPVALVPKENRVPIDGTMVRREMARGGNWHALVPAEIASYIQENKLDLRFKQEFGLETLALDTIIHERSKSQ